MAVKARNDCPADLIAKLLDQYNKLQADVASLRSYIATHVHTENTAAAYTQNATTTAPTTAPPALTSDIVSPSL